MDAVHYAENLVPLRFNQSCLFQSASIVLGGEIGLLQRAHLFAGK